MTLRPVPSAIGPGGQAGPVLDHTLSLPTALAEAHRCLMCWDAPCTRACPTSIDVPGFIKRIANRDELGAARIILGANVLGDSCAHACPTEVLCEGACVMNDVDGRAVAIGDLQGYATAPVVRLGTQIFQPLPATGHRVAVVGAGPAGLACAAELTRRGHAVVAFDAADEPGGLNTHGVAEYKVPHDAAFAEIQWIEDGGVEIRRGSAIGTDVEFGRLLEDFDAVFVGVGLGAIRPLGIAGEDLPGVHDALSLIASAKAGDLDADALGGQAVVVLGGGNTAIDAARLAIRLGAASVTVVYRRGPEQMPAYRHEIDEAHAEGVAFAHWLAPESIVGDGTAAAVRCHRTIPGDIGPDGRPSVVMTEEEADVPCDVVVVATGQASLGSFLGGVAHLELDAKGRVVVDGGYRTSHPSVWAGGDCVNGGKEVVNAVAEGMAAARDIDRALNGGR